MNTMSVSRRKFAQLLGAGAAATLVRPRLSFAKPTQPNTTSSTAGGTVVRLSANENPYGPSPKGLQAITDSFDGSGEILKLCAETFTGQQRGPLIAADPTFEAILKNAAANGAEVVKVPLTNSFVHDLPKMLTAARGGLIYVCNPNNPTASITPKDELRDFIAKTPRETMILVDEAYFHYADSPDYESVITLTKDHPSLILSRTFSKIYGMAGLRCGYCVAQKETIDRMRPYQMWDSVNIMALAAASASLDDPDQVPNGQRLNSEAKMFVTSELARAGYKTIPSQANFIMIDCRRPVVPLIKAMKEQNVHVGRLFPALPNHMRVTIGKKTEMETFVSAFKQVTA